MTYPASNPLPFLSPCRMRSAPLTLAALGWLLLVSSTTLFSAELSPSWKTRWEKTVEGAAVSPFNGTVSLVNRAPHPNAARVLINWLPSREGQTAVQQHLAGEGNIRESLREDIAKDAISLAQRRDPRVKYVMISRSVDLDGENDAIKLADDALARAEKKQ
jgi:ABC-type Fe3+ transport system substrate-binding protein